MWAKDEGFKDIIMSSMGHQLSNSWLEALKNVLCKLRQPLKQLNGNRYVDIYNQQAKAWEELTTIQSQLQHDPGNMELLQKEVTCREHYVKVSHSAISLLKQ